MKQRGVSSLSSRAPRRDVEFGAFAARTDGSEALITVSNLSYEGCQLRTHVLFRSGEKVELNLPRLGHIGAEIRWIAEGKAGARFIVEEVTSE